MKPSRTRMMCALLGALAAAVHPSRAEACGGCFTGPSTVQVVTDHRMVLSIARAQTTLWDQFQYSGNPADFSWILPVRYTERTQVALADDGFMRMADSLTAPIVTPPNNPCPQRFASDTAAPGAFSDAAAASDGGVTVLRQEVIGPYAVSIIRGENPMAIRDWLRMNGYTVPREVEPIIDHYTTMRMDYVALRLRPGEGVNRMSPVRVTVEGLMPLLPLRMIAAGVADRVGLSLVVLAESRYEAMNFPNGEIREADLTWDFARPSNPASDFLAAFDALNRATGDRLWLTESAMVHTQTSWLEAAPRFRGSSVPGCPPGVPGCVRPPGPDAGTEVDAGDGGTLTTDPMDDVRVAFTGLGERATVTRLRANMLASMLTQDLRLGASDRGERNRNYTYGRRLNDPGPMCMGLRTPGAPSGNPSSDDAMPASSEGGIRCSSTPGRYEDRTTLLASLLALGTLGLALRARPRR